MIPKLAYRMIEEVVGEENVSDDPVILDSYSFQYLAELQEGGAKWLPRPAAVVLPGSTEEVQAVVKICNRFNIKFKAHSTGWGVWSGVGREGVILLDLRRMNRIVMIDEDNMYAVVEPYVTFAQLQVEAMKKGLTCHIIGAGANASVLASCTSMCGYGWTGIKMSHSGRNVLAVEWVLPTGEILRLGSLGCGSGWFCGDGPGPSLRGAMRGWAGTLGGLGVFTKCAVKLYEWPGPSSLEVKGATPFYEVEVPENFRVYVPVFPDWKSFADAAYMVGEAEIGMVMCRNAPFLIGMALSPSVKDFYSLWESGALKDARFNFVIVLGGSKRQVEYEEKVLRAILEKTGGRNHPLAEDEFTQRQLFLAMIKCCYNARGVFKASGSFHTSLGSLESWDSAVRGAKIGEALKKRFIEAGALTDDGGDNAWGGIYEHGYFGHLEELFLYDPRDPASKDGAREYLQACVNTAIEERLGFGLEALTEGAETHDTYGPLMCNYHKWMRKIKAALDPKNLSDHSFYISPSEEDQ